MAQAQQIGAEANGIGSEALGTALASLSGNAPEGMRAHMVFVPKAVMGNYSWAVEVIAYDEKIFHVAGSRGADNGVFSASPSLLGTWIVGDAIGDRNSIQSVFCFQKHVSICEKNSEFDCYLVWLPLGWEVKTRVTCYSQEAPEIHVISADRAGELPY